MTRFSGPFFVSILLIPLLFSGVAARGAESTTSPAVEKQPAAPPNIVSLQAFKDDLPTSAEELHLQQFIDLKKQGPVVVLDVRAKEVFDKRHLKGSLNAPLTGLTDKTLPQLIPDKNTPVVLACDFSFQPVRTIAMTLQAYPVLKAAGYTKIYRLNLWTNPAPGGHMIGDTEQEQALGFEGTDVKP